MVVQPESELGNDQSSSLANKPPKLGEAGRAAAVPSAARYDPARSANAEHSTAGSQRAAAEPAACDRPTTGEPGAAANYATGKSAPAAIKPAAQSTGAASQPRTVAG